jgi:WD40 repeat protein
MSQIWSVTFDAQAGCVEPSPDGAMLAVGFGTGEIRLLNAADGKEIRTLTGHEDSVAAIAWVPHTDYLISAGYDQTLRLWDIKTGWELRKMGGHLSPLRSVTVSRDGRMAASAGGDGVVTIWDLKSGAELRWFPAHSGMINTMAFSPDGRVLATGSLDKSLQLWNPREGARVVEFKTHTSGINAVAFSADGELVFSGADGFEPSPAGPIPVEDETIQSHSVFGNRKPVPLPKLNDWVLSLSVSADGDWLACGTGGAPSEKQQDLTPRLIFIDLRTGTPVEPQVKPDGSVSAVRFHPNKAILFTATLAGKISAWNVK